MAYKDIARDACELAMTTLRGDDPRPVRAIVTALRWLTGEATTRELKTAELAAYDYAHSGGNPAAAYAAATTYACTVDGLAHYVEPYYDATVRAVENV